VRNKQTKETFMIQAQRRILLTMTALLFLFAACAPAQPTVTQEPVDISDEVATSVALTVAAQNTQTAEARGSSNPYAYPADLNPSRAAHSDPRPRRDSIAKTRICLQRHQPPTV
jgi:hypothetical protein